MGSNPTMNNILSQIIAGTHHDSVVPLFLLLEKKPTISDVTISAVMIPTTILPLEYFNFLETLSAIPL